jgi:hypothetical protein
MRGSISKFQGPVAGGVDLWILEMTSPAYLVRAGWEGDHLESRRESEGGCAFLSRTAITGGIFRLRDHWPDGRTLTEQAQPAAPPAAQAK